MGLTNSQVMSHTTQVDQLCQHMSSATQIIYMRQVPSQNEALEYLNLNNKLSTLMSVQFDDLDDNLYQKHQCKNGQQYYGQVVNNMFDGKGILISQRNSSIYNGMFKYGYKHGLGTIHQSQQQYKYVGEWRLGFMEGQGTTYFCTDQHRFASNNNTTAKRIANVEARKGSTLTTDYKLSLDTDEIGYSLFLQILHTFLFFSLLYFSNMKNMYYYIGQNNLQYVQQEASQSATYFIMSLIFFILISLFILYHNFNCQTMYCFKNIVTKNQFKEMLSQAKTNTFKIDLQFKSWHYKQVRSGKSSRRVQVISSNRNKPFKFLQVVDFSADLDEFQTLDSHEYVFVHLSDKIYFTENSRQSYDYQLNLMIESGQRDQYNYSAGFYNSPISKKHFLVCKDNSVVQQMNCKVLLYYLSIFGGFGVYFKMIMRLNKQVMHYRLNKYVLR